MHELNDARRAADHDAVGADLADEVLHGHLVALAAVDHAADVDPAPVRRDQRVGDRPRVEVAER